MKRHSPRQRRTRKPPSPEWEEFFCDEETSQDVLDMSLADAGLSVRTVNTLEREGILLVGELALLHRQELLEFENFGEKTLVECDRQLNSLRVKHPDWLRPQRKRGTRSK